MKMMSPKYKLNNVINRSGLAILLFAMVLCLPSCDKDSDQDKIGPYEYGRVTDVEGNTYKTVKIGDQWWMAEDLKATVYRDGTPVSQLQAESAWITGQEGYCIFDNNPTAPGILYNWYAVTDSRNLAPPGWRVATETDWQILEQHLGISISDVVKTGWRGSNQGEQLKSTGTTGWLRYGDVWPTNSSGFTALAGGCRLPNATFGDPGLFCTGFWWAASEHSPEEAWYRHLDYKTKNIFRFHSNKNYGFNVRCVKE